jgi:transketolase
MNDVAALIAAGITVFEALKAYEELRKEGIEVRVIDAYSVEPLDREQIVKEVAEAGGRAVVVEDHFLNGGLADAVSSALGGRAMVFPLGIKELPRSGKPQELLDAYGISARAIQAAVRELLGR